MPIVKIRQLIKWLGGLLVLFVGFILAILILPEYKGPLESIPMGNVSFEKGDSLADVATKIEQSIREKGLDWKVEIASDVASRRSTGYGSGGGSVLAAAIGIKDNFGCRCSVEKEKKRIWIAADNGR